MWFVQTESPQVPVMNIIYCCTVSGFTVYQTDMHYFPEEYTVIETKNGLSL